MQTSVHELTMRKRRDRNWKKKSAYVDNYYLGFSQAAVDDVNKTTNGLFIGNY